MHRIDRYIFGEIFGPFISALAFLFTLLFAMQMLRGIEIMLGASVSAFDLFYVALCLVPHFVVMAVPISFLFAVVIGLGRLSEDREIMALQASGAGPARLWVAPVTLAAVLSGIGIGVGYGPEPIGLAEVDRHINELIKKNMAGDVKPGIFYDAIRGITLFAQEVDSKSRRFTNVLLVDERENSESTLWLARGGYVDPHGSGSSLLLQLDDGEIHRATEGDSDQEASSVMATFDQCTLNIQARELLKKNRFGATRREAMLPSQLKAAAAKQRQEAAELRHEAEEMLLAGIPQATDAELDAGTAEKAYLDEMARFSASYVPLHPDKADGAAEAGDGAGASRFPAQPTSVAGTTRGEPTDAVSSALTSMVPEAAKALEGHEDALERISKAVDKSRPEGSLTQRSKVILDAKKSLKRDQIKRAIKKEKEARKIDVARARRLSGPLASIVFAMCAVPLAIGRKQRGGGIGILATMACYIGYYTLERLGEGMGESGVLPAMLAAQIPNIAFLLVGIWLVRRSLRVT